ncbi:MAG: acyltransferase [Sphingobacteriaceae bacterium]|nr:acyltransferase [Sphingobacteriaceae bacterium]
MKFTLIQVFRGVAAMLVIMHHLIANTTNHLNYVAYGNFFNFGFIGVDFFFVLSGFIITYVHFSDLTSSDNIRARCLSFFKKRFIRIYPIYWVVAVITLLIYLKSTPQFMKDEGLTMDLTSPVIQSLLIKSFLLIPDEAMRLIGVAWTLSYEVLFYLVFGLSITFGFKFAKWTGLAWAILIVVNSFVSRPENEYLNFFFNIIILEFLVGCVVAYLIRMKANIPLKFTAPVLAILSIFLLKNMHIEGLVFQRELLSVMAMALFFGVLTYMAVDFDLKNTSIKFPAFLVLIGDASYSIYLTHNMSLSAMTRIYSKLNPGFSETGYLALVATLIFAGSVVGGVIVHLLIEKKLLTWLNKKAAPQKAKPVRETELV